MTSRAAESRSLPKKSSGSSVTGSILAVGETFDLDFCRASGLALKEEGTIIVDRFSLETSRPGFYAGGDVITGASNVSQRNGLRQAGRPQHRRAADGRKPLGPDLPEFAYDQKAPEEPNTSRRHTSHSVSVNVRVKSHDEVVPGLEPEEAWEEACRCLRCDIKNPCERQLKEGAKSCRRRNFRSELMVSW